MKRSIGFDLDGTLLNSKFRHQKVLYDILKNEIYDIKFSDLDDFVLYKSEGNNTKSYLKYKYLDHINIDEISKKWIENIEKKQYLELDILYKHTINLLKTLSKPYDLHLVTARKNKEGVKHQIYKHDIVKYFKKIYVVSNKGYVALNKYNQTKNICIELIIGDTEVDLKWAEYLDTKFLPVNYGFRSEKWWNSRNIISNDEKELDIKIKEIIKRK